MPLNTAVCKTRPTKSSLASEKSVRQMTHLWRKVYTILKPPQRATVAFPPFRQIDPKLHV
jgi:hypothetical protein